MWAGTFYSVSEKKNITRQESPMDMYGLPKQQVYVLERSQTDARKLVCKETGNAS